MECRERQSTEVALAKPHWVDRGDFGVEGRQTPRGVIAIGAPTGQMLAGSNNVIPSRLDLTPVDDLAVLAGAMMADLKGQSGLVALMIPAWAKSVGHRHPPDYHLDLVRARPVDFERR